MHGTVSTKMKGVLRGKETFFLAASVLFQSILKIVARLFLKFEENKLLALEVEHAVHLARKQKTESS